MSQALTTSLRPKKFSQMVGSKTLTRQITKIYKSGKMPFAWMLSGPTGVGKTTIARIMAVSLQCKHREFGEPCSHCYKHRHAFDITTLNVQQRKVEDLESAISGAYYAPKPGSRRRVYILDEAHMLTDHSQNLLLEVTEEPPRTTNWIVCTTHPDKILPTLQSRCVILPVPSLDLDEIKQLVKRGLKIYHSERSSSDLAEKLLEKNITSPRLILQAVTKYIDLDTTVEEAAQVTLVSDKDTYVICRTLQAGDWGTLAQLLNKSREEDNTAIRKSVSGYLNGILLGDAEFNNRTDLISKSIIQLNQIGDDFNATCAVLYKVCKYFRRYTK